MLSVSIPPNQIWKKLFQVNGIFTVLIHFLADFQVAS